MQRFSHLSIHVVEDNLPLVNHLGFGSGLDNLAAPLVKSFHGGIAMRVCLVVLPVLNTLGDLVVTEVITEKLADVSGILVGTRPCIVLGIPRWGLLLLLAFFLLFGRRLLLATLAFGFWLVFLLFFLNGLFDHLAGRLEFSRFSLGSQINAASNRSDVAHDAEEFVHKAHLEAVSFIGKLAIVQQTFDENETLIGAVLRNLLLDELHDQVLVVVYGRVLTLFIRVNVLHDWSKLHALGALRLGKGTAKRGLRENLLSDQLVGRQVEQVVLDGQIGAGGVNVDAFLVDYKHNFGAELFVHCLEHAILGGAGVEAELLHTLHAIGPARAVGVSVSFSLCGFIFKHLDILFTKVFTDFIFLFVTVLDYLFIGRARDDVTRCTKVVHQEFSGGCNCIVMLTVDDVEEFVSVVLVGFEHGEDVLFNLGVWNFALKWSILGLESRTDILSNLG